MSGTELSGYAADASSARTPGEFLKKALASGHKVSSNNTTAGGNVSGVTRPLSQSPATVSKQNKSKRTKINPLHFVAEDDEDDVNDEVKKRFRCTNFPRDQVISNNGARKDNIFLANLFMPFSARGLVRLVLNVFRIFVTIQRVVLGITFGTIRFSNHFTHEGINNINRGQRSMGDEVATRAVYSATTGFSNLKIQNFMK